jgi:hypothetical protein
MNVVRLAVGVGLMGLGGVAIFMGAVVLMTTLSSGKVTYSMIRDGQSVTTSIEKSTDANAYWSTLGWTGALPAILGLVAVFVGRRVVKG